MAGPEGHSGGNAFVVLVSGIEVGDLVLIDDGDPEVRQLLPIVDTSFGLERLVSAAGAGMRYSTLIGPLPPSAVPELTAPLDHLRTATLMLMAGLTPSGKGRGRILRSLSTTDIPPGWPLDIDAVVAHAHTYWAVFLASQRDLHQCQAIIRAERQRHVNRILLEAVGRHSPRTIPVAMTADALSPPTPSLRRL